MSTHVRSLSRSIGCRWIDHLPDDWDVVPIKYLAIGEASYFDDGDWIESKDIADSGIRYLTTGNVGQGIFKIQGSGFISEETFKSLGCKYVYPGDLLISRLNLPMGRACIIPRHEEKYVTAVDNVILRPKKGISKHYLLFLFSSAPYFAHMRDLARGSTMVRVSRTILGNVRVPIPVYSEQIQIAAYLNRETAKIDKLIAKQQKLIKLLQEKRQAVISQAVTKGLDPNVKMKDSGVEWLGKVPIHWSVSKLKYYGDVIDCKHITAEFFDEGYPLASIAEVKSWFVNLVNSKKTNDYFYNELTSGGRKPEVGNILYSRNATVGKASLVPLDIEPFAMGQDVCLIKLGAALKPEFAMYLFRSDVVAKQLDVLMVGSTFKRINVDDIRNYSISLPPFLEQENIVRYLETECSKIDQLVSVANVGIDLIREHRQALITAAVTGTIDVRGLVTDEEVAALDADPVLETTEEDFESEVAEADYITEEE